MIAPGDAVDVPQQLNEIPRELQILHDSVKSLNDCLRELENRLSQITIPEPMQIVKNDDVKSFSEARTGLGNDIYKAHREIAELQIFVSDLISRIAI